MKTVEHLTKEQIQAYAADSLAQIESSAIEKHLLQCAACRDALPAPTPERFWSALLEDEPKREESFAIENLSPAKSPFATVFSFFRQPVAWGAAALILLAGISFLIWIGTAKQSNPKTQVAQTVEAPKVENKLPTDEKLSVTTGDETKEIENSENSQPSSRRPKEPDVDYWRCRKELSTLRIWSRESLCAFGSGVKRTT